MSDDLRRTLSLRDLVLLLVGTVIGSGVFVVPGAVLRQVGGHAGPALLVWLAGGVLTLLGAITYAEIGSLRPRTGGLYVFIRDAFGPLPAFLFGWTLFFVIGSGSVAALAVASTAYLDRLVPLGPMARRASALLLILVVAVVNIRGTKKSAGVQTWATAIKVGAILVMSAVFIGAGRGTAEVGWNLWPAGGSVPWLVGVGPAMVGVLWAYEGWTYATLAAGEAIDPQRTVPRGLIIGGAALIVLYLLANVGYLAALGPSAVAGTDSVAADAVGSVVGPAAGKVVAAVIFLSMLSAANGLVLTTPRVFFAMARDGVFFSRLGEIHPRFGTPAVAITAGSLCAAVLAGTGTFDQLLTYVVFTGWIFYALGAASIFVFRRREPDAVRPFRVPAYPLPPLLFVLAAAAVVASTVIAQPGRALAGMAVVLAGVPAYLLWKRARRAPRAGS